MYARDQDCIDSVCVAEYKKARQEIKKAASDTMRLQKKVKKGVPHGIYIYDCHTFSYITDVKVFDQVMYMCVTSSGLGLMIPALGSCAL